MTMESARDRYPLLTAIIRDPRVPCTALDFELSSALDEIDRLRAIAGVAELIAENAVIEPEPDLCDLHPECLLARGHDGPCAEPDGTPLPDRSES
jgi:hypothetical protein